MSQNMLHIVAETRMSNTSVIVDSRTALNSLWHVIEDALATDRAARACPRRMGSFTAWRSFLKTTCTRCTRPTHSNLHRNDQTEKP